MKKAILVTSVIDVDNTYPLTYSNVRSIFSNEERLRQTIFTLSSLDRIIDDETTIFLVDSSKNSAHYKAVLAYQPNLVFINVAEEFPDLFDIIRTHSHKSHCETILQLAFFNRYKDLLKEYDFFFKLSGRYFFDRSFNLTHCTNENTGKLFFKHPLKFEWQDTWPYEMVDRRSTQQDNTLRQYCSVLYGWTSEYHEKMLDIYRVIAEFTNNPNGLAYDLETLLYFFTRPYEKDIVETDWKIYGWEGVSGTYMRY
jgi:hypothetical protein